MFDMRNKEKSMIKLLEYNTPLGWGNSKFVLEIDGQKHFVVENMIQGHFSPEGSFYYEVDENFYYNPAQTPGFKRLIYQDCQQLGNHTYVSEGYKLINVVLGIGTIAAIARVLQGYSVEPTGHYFNSFMNEEGINQAIVYPYTEMEWGKFKNTNEAFREKSAFEKTKQELLDKGFTQSKAGVWIQNK